MALALPRLPQRIEIGLAALIGIGACIAGVLLADQPGWTGEALFAVGFLLLCGVVWRAFRAERLAGAVAVDPDNPESHVRVTGSVSRRMLLIATAWILLLLLGGGFTLNRVITEALTNAFDTQLEYLMGKMILNSEVGPSGELLLGNQFADQRFIEPYSGSYWQVTGKGFPPFRSQSLWFELVLKADHVYADRNVHFYDSDEFSGQHLRVAEQNVKLDGSPLEWRYQIAESRTELDTQIQSLRSTLIRSFLLLGVGLIAMAVLQTWYGLRPLRKVRSEIARLRGGWSKRIEGSMPADIAPMVEELNALLEHNDRQAEEARRHAGNLAHALKTPLTVIMNAAAAGAEDLPDTVVREARTMRRQVDHHLARARAVGRRGSAHSRTAIWPSIEAVERAVARLYPNVRIDVDGAKDPVAHIERQDFDEILGNLVENAAKYGGGSVFVTARAQAGYVEVLVEDDGKGIPEGDRQRIFDRGVRLDSGKPGTGLGLAIVRDVAEIYGGTVSLEESEDLGGLMVRLRLPAAG